MSNSIAQWFGWNRVVDTEELPNIFPLPILQSEFISTDIFAIYSKILTDVLERTHGLPDDLVELMWDNCVKSNSSEGIITLLSKAMADKKDLFIIYEPSFGIVRVATAEERREIEADYDAKGFSEVGVYISFKNYRRSDMVKLYIGLEYLSVASLHKSMNLSKAVQIKINDLRSSVSLVDASDAKAQAKRIATSLSQGLDIMLDAKDVIETSTPDLTATKESVSFVTQKLSFYLGLPAAYISGEQTTGMGTTGENDMRAVERGLKGYFFSIIKPTLETLFDLKLSYKSQDFRQIAGSMDVLKTFALIDEEFISRENKTKIINQLLDLPEDAVGDAVAQAIAPIVPPQGNA